MKNPKHQIHPGALLAAAVLALSATASADTFQAVADGKLSDFTTWGRPGAVAGDTNVWQSGTRSLAVDGTMANSPSTFHGGTLVIQTGGEFNPRLAGTELSLNNLILDGGTITRTRYHTLTLDLTGHTCTLNSGTLETGRGDGNRHILFRNGRLAGSGTINITALGPVGYQVEFDETIDTTGFTGIFDVHTDGVLRLAAGWGASFGMRLSGSGKFFNRPDSAFTSLVIDGVSIPPGSHAYNDFTPSQQAHFSRTTGTITVTGTTGGDKTAIADGNLNDTATWGILPPVEGDSFYWSTGTHTVGGDGLAADSELHFHGGRLIVNAGGSLSSKASGLTLFVNGLELDGGTIDQTATRPFVINLGGQNFVMDDGVIRAGVAVGSSRDIRFANGSLAGNGVIDITVNGATQKFDVQFLNTIDTSGFTGVFNVVNNGTLKLTPEAVSTASFGIRLSSASKLNLTSSANLRVASLELDGVSFPAGVHHIAALPPEQQAYFSTAAGTIEVVDTAYSRWASDYEETVGAKADDDDGDGQSNFHEVTLGGDPTDARVTASAPTYAMTPDSGNDYFVFSHLERNDLYNSPTRYVVEACDDLADAEWTTTGVVRYSTEFYDSEYNLVTHRIVMTSKPRLFARLRIE